MKKEGKGDSMVILFILSFLCLVAAVVIYMKREDTGFEELAGKYAGLQTLVNGLDLKVQYAASWKQQLDDEKQIRLVQYDKFSKKIEALEMEIDAIKRKKSIVPTTIKVEVTNPVALKTLQPFQVITREGPKAKLAKKPTSKVIVDPTIKRNSSVLPSSFHGQE